MKPRIIEDPIYQLLREEKIDEFNDARKDQPDIDFTSCDFRGLDLREMDVEGIDFGDAYFRGADLRGIDFRKANIVGASFASAQISGCYLPANIDAAEMELSLSRGTRLRANSLVDSDQ